MKFEKCPYCGDLKMSKLQSPDGTKIALTSVDTSVSPAVFDPASGLVVEAYGCASCKGVMLRCPTITF